MRQRYLLVPAALLLGLALPFPALAQRHDHDRHVESRDPQRWLERCRRGDWDDDDRERFCELRSMGWRGGGPLDVDMSPNGGVSVIGWDRDSVDIVVKVQASAYTEAEARELAQQVRVTRDGGRLRVDGPGTRRRTGWSVSLEVRAPRRTDLTLESMNGPVSVEEVSGRMDLRVQNGPLTLYAVAGDVTARAQNGPLHVELTGTRWEGSRLDASTQNGPIVVELPENYNAELETGTINGPMTLGFPIMMQGRIGAGRRDWLRTTLGSGGPTIRAVTTNGPAVIRRS